jgi:hypothetical protein
MVIHTNRYHEQLPRSHHADNAICVFENFHHHFFFGLWRRLVLWMRTWVHNAIHVQIQIIHLFPVRIRSSVIDGNLLAIDRLRMFLDDWGDDLGVFVGKPTKEGGDTHRDELFNEELSSSRDCEENNERTTREML